MRWLGYHHRLNGHEFEQTLGDSEGQGRLVCCSPWGLKELDTTERLNSSTKLDWSRQASGIVSHGARVLNQALLPQTHFLFVARDI